MDQRGLADLTWDARNDDGSPRAASHRLLVFPRSLVPLYYLGFRRLWAGRGITGRRGPSARGVARRGLSAFRCWTFWDSPLRQVLLVALGSLDIEICRLRFATCGVGRGTRNDL